MILKAVYQHSPPIPMLQEQKKQMSIQIDHIRFWLKEFPRIDDGLEK